MSIRIVEVGPRDGLQNEALPIPVEAKLRFVQKLTAAGLSEIEVGSFVSPKWVPQMAGTDELATHLTDNNHYSYLVPNMKGLERALSCGVSRIALFIAASNTFTQKNIGMTLSESITACNQVIAEFRQRTAGHIRVYISTAFQCPYEGRINPEQVKSVVNALANAPIDEVALGDTIGVAVPSEVKRLNQVLEPDKLPFASAYHFHDTYGTAIANVAQAIEDGITNFDSSAAGLGGCPYAPGAGGNLATEDLVYFLERSGYATGVNLDSVAAASQEILQLLGRSTRSKVGVAVASSHK